MVDDEPDIVRIVTKIMEALGHRVTEARDGQAALDAVKTARPDCVILDLNLPKVDGFEVCRRLKADTDTSSIPIVMLTAAYPSVEEASRGLGEGADEYVIKPFLREVLVHNVQRLLPKA